MTARASTTWRAGIAAALLLIGGARTVAALCAPSASAILPASGIAGTSITASITGNGLSGATLTVYGDPGLTATVQSSSDVALGVHLDLDAAAAPGERILFVETPGGSTGVSFVINAAGGPVVTDVSPPLIGTLGLPLDVTLTGQNLGGVTTASFAITGAGISVTAATPSADGMMLALTFLVAATADLGTHAVVLGTATGSAV
ncbi:MAG TPA: hypothetical protein VGJ70_10880, partial [Solirubrobacteraceae bacterium]